MNTSAEINAGLIFRAPEPNYAHDYHPSWDKEVDEQPDAALVEQARAAGERAYTDAGDPFEVWAVKLHPGIVAGRPARPSRSSRLRGSAVPVHPA